MPKRAILSTGDGEQVGLPVYQQSAGREKVEMLLAALGLGFRARAVVTDYVDVPDVCADGMVANCALRRALKANTPYDGRRGAS